MLTHINAKGEAHMVDVGKKPSTQRTAIASSFVAMQAGTLSAIKDDVLVKGDVLATARIAGIQAAKRCSDLIPLCHPLLLTQLAIDFELYESEHRAKASDDPDCGAVDTATASDTGIRIFARVSVSGQTGVEMEALAAVSVAALTIFDMAKAIDKTMTITDTRLEFKLGGKSGIFSTGHAGQVLAINLSTETGEQKVSSSKTLTFVEGHGIEGDAHAGDWHRQISLLDQSSVDQLIAKGLELKPGDFAENVTTTGLKLQTLAIGTQLRVGQALLEITQIGKECHTRCAIYQQAGDCVMPRDGVFATVVESGQVRAGDTIYVLGARHFGPNSKPCTQLTLGAL